MELKINVNCQNIYIFLDGGSFDSAFDSEEDNAEFPSGERSPSDLSGGGEEARHVLHPGSINVTRSARRNKPNE